MSTESDSAILGRLRVDHPGWTVGRTESGLAWQAVTKPTERSERTIIGRTLAGLEARLDQISGQRA
jgi:hypothetical protein